MRPGLYWLAEPDREPEVVVVAEYQRNLLVVQMLGDEGDYPVSGFKDAQWFGPISAPPLD
ncbi:hypothetical protein WJ36_10625 [Burkholderia ubonensis]|nr:hypothetical protein WJ36_10625 [Burkholderia ubonensis]